MFGVDPLTTGALLILAASNNQICQMPQPTKINVKPTAQKVEFDYSKSLKELQATQTDTINPYDFTGISHTLGFARGAIQTEVRVKLGQQYLPRYKAVCVWYEEVNIGFKIDPEITIAKEVAADRCKGKAVKEHELKHVKADRRIVNKYAKIIGKKVYNDLKARGFVAGPVRVSDTEVVSERMQRTVLQIVEREGKRMDLDRADAQQAVDSLEEYERVGKLCPKWDAKAALAGKTKPKR